MGCGTEATCVAVITDTDKGIKYPLVSYELCPDIAIVDGELAVSMPPNVTADTGMDALSHDVEAFVAALACPYTDALAGSEAVIQYWLWRAGLPSLPHASSPTIADP